MTARDAFGVVIRACAMYFLLRAFENIGAAIIELIGLYPTNQSPPSGQVLPFIIGWFVYGLYYLVGGVVLLKGTNKITDWAYGEEPARPLYQNSPKG